MCIYKWSEMSEYVGSYVISTVKIPQFISRICVGINIITKYQRFFDYLNSRFR